MKTCIVNLATDNGWYRAGQRRLGESLDAVGCTHDRLFFTSEGQVGAPLHRDVPYAFKAYAIQAARDAGYRRIFWLDCSMWAIRPLTPIEVHLGYIGFWYEECGFNVAQWTSDVCLAHFGIGRDQARRIPMFSSGMMAFDTEFPYTRVFLDGFLGAAKYAPEVFRGSWTNKNGEVSTDPECQGHRHDQSVASIIAHGVMVGSGSMMAYVSMKPHSSDTYLRIIGTGPAPNPETIFNAQGM